MKELNRSLAGTLGALVVAACTLTTSCSSCGKKEPERDGLLVPEKDTTPLELSPLPAPPAVQVAPGSIPGIPAGPVAVVVARPQKGWSGARPAITFNKPLVSLGDRDATKPPAIRIEPAIEGEWKWIGTSSVEFAPKTDFPWATHFTVTVDAGLTAVDGTKLEQPYSFSFDTTEPRLERTDPRDGWRWLPQDGRISLFFNMPMASDLASKLALTVDGKAMDFTLGPPIDVAAEEAKKRKQPLVVERKWFGAPTRYELQPKSRLPAGARVVVELKEGAAAAEGPLPAPPTKVSLSVMGPMKLTSARACPTWRDTCPYGPILLYATNEPDVESLKGRIHLDPPARIDEDELTTMTSQDEGAWAEVSAQLRPGTTYTIRVDAGVKDATGQSAPAFTTKVKLDDVEPDLRVTSSLALLEASGDQSFPVEAVNIPSVDAYVAPLTASQMAVLVAKDAATSVGATAVRKVVDTSAARNVAVRKPLPLADVFPPGAPKLFRLELSAPGTTIETQRVLGQITDLATHSKIGATSGVVWVTSLSSGQPVGGASVTIYDEAGKELHTATTGDDGVARVPGLTKLVNTKDAEGWWNLPPVVVAASKGGDTGITLATWDGELGPSSAGMMTDFDGDQPKLLGRLVAERGIYRPGDEVFLKGLARVRRNGEIKLPKLDGELELVVSIRGKEISKEKVTLTKFGTFSTSVKLPDGAPLGWYEAEATAKIEDTPVRLSTYFRVEEYRAPKFKVDVSMQGKELVAGDPLVGRVDARYLFGGGMPGASVEATALRSTEDWTPPASAHLERWQFGVHTWGYDDGEPEEYTSIIARKNTTVAADGSVVVDLGVAETHAGRTARVTLEAEVADVSRQRVSNRASVIVHPASVYAGVRAGDGFGEVNQPMPIELVAASIDGTRAAGVKLHAVVERREWKSIRQRDPHSGRFTTVSEPTQIPVSTCDKVSDASAPVRCDVTPDKPGLYVVKVTATDDKGRTQETRVSTYVVGGGWVSWQRTDGDLIELVADKETYEPGQTAKILVKSPWPDATALITVEREGVQSARTTKLAGAAATFEVPIDDTAIPNIFASVVVVRGRVKADDASPKEIDPGRPQVRVGYVKLNVEKKKKRLDVSVDAGPGPHRPGQKTRLHVAVKDWQGAGVPAEVTVWAVDEAVLRLTDYELIDPVEAIHQARGLSVRLGEPLLFLLRQQGYGEKGRPPGGDGGGDGGAGFRSSFKTTAFFLPSVITDAQGRADVEVQLPDGLTTYRVMAIAVNEGDLLGKGGAEIVVQKPLLALPALPRLARVGDTFEAGVVVHAKNAGDVKVTAEVDGLKLAGEATRDVHVDADHALEVRFPFTAEKAGRARLRFRVTGGGESDGVEQLLPVVLPTIVETVAAAGDTADKREEGVAPPQGVLPDVGGLEVSLASTALAGYQEALKQLVEYPYGCAEQLSSRLVPFLALREMQGAFGLKHEGGDQDQKLYARWLGLEPRPGDDVIHPDDVVARTIRELVGLQDADGGFRYWDTSSCEDPQASAYATLALARAKELGYEVPADVVAKGQRFLAEKVAPDRLPSCGFDRHASLVERTFAVWTLARTGAPKNGFLEELFGKRKDMPIFAKAMLADAHAVGGPSSSKSPRLQALLVEVMNGAKESAREVHFEETNPERWWAFWSSDVRTTAIVLMTLVDAQPDHPFVQKAATYLQTARKAGRYRTTQEAAFSLMAISELMRTKERDPPDFDATVSLGGKALVQQGFHGRSLDVVTTAIPMAQLGGNAAALVFAKTGTGNLSYTAALRYAKAEMPREPLDAGMAVQRWFEPWLSAPGAGQARKVRAGELVRLKVRVATPQERRFVAIEVPLPAGLEIVDDSLASSSRAQAKQRGDEGEEGEYEGDYEGEYEGGDGIDAFEWSPFNHTELRDDRAIFFADVLPPGVHTAMVVARATTIGTFILKPATAEEMYAPEVSGRSDGGTFEVTKP
jgi:hypothetical protein